MGGSGLGGRASSPPDAPPSSLTANAPPKPTLSTRVQDAERDAGSKSQEPAEIAEAPGADTSQDERRDESTALAQQTNGQSSEAPSSDSTADASSAATEPAEEPAPPSVADVEEDELGVQVEPDAPPPSLRAMRMISIGVTRPPPPEERKRPPIIPPIGYSDDVDIEVSVAEEGEELELAIEAEDEEVAAPVVARSKPPPPPRSRTSDPPPPAVAAEAAVDLTDDDVAPASTEEPDVGDGDGIEELALESIESAKPPPPPKRRPQQSSPAAAEVDPAKAKAAKDKRRVKPWWEELFSDDFSRALTPLTEAQVEREVTFIEESLGVTKGGVVLDLACGIGQHAVTMAARGYAVVGFDLSLPQLALAGELAQERGQKINFLQGDMRDMAFEEMFDGIYCWNTSFGYFEEEKNVTVAQHVFRALRPGGSFLLDVINRDYAVGQQPSSVWFEGDACVCMDDMSVDFITSRLKVKRTLMLDDGRSRECGYSIRIYSLHELGKMLHDIGFRVTEASGHPAYPGVFFGAQSPRVIILAQKP